MKIKVGDKIKSHGMTMVITSETDTHFHGYNEFNDERHDISFRKEILDNPFYNVEIVKD